MAKKKTERILGGIGDAAVLKRTGKSWADWLKTIDAGGGKTLDHRGIVAYLESRHPKVGDWWRQMVTVGYEQARGKRVKHEKVDGFSVSASKTIDAPLDRLYAAWIDPRARRDWLGDAPAVIRSATERKSLRIVWEGGASRVSVNFYGKGTGKSQVTVQHEKLPNASAGKKLQGMWKERLASLKAALEGKTEAASRTSTDSKPKTIAKEPRSADSSFAFTSRLVAAGENGSWTCLNLSAEQSARLGRRARVPVLATFNGTAFHTSAHPTGDGTHTIMINKQMQAQIGAKAGDRVEVELEIDDQPRTVNVPAELEAAFKKSAAAKRAFEKLSYSHQKAHVDHVAEAKKTETRVKRAAETVKRLL